MSGDKKSNDHLTFVRAAGMPVGGAGPDPAEAIESFAGAGMSPPAGCR
jgi:hypothetical protein